MAKRKIPFEEFQETLKNMSPEELLNAYIESKYGYNYTDDKLPAVLVSDTLEKLYEILDQIKTQQN